jgi:hypothetical protein
VHVFLFREILLRLFFRAFFSPGFGGRQKAEEKQHSEPAHIICTGSPWYTTKHMASESTCVRLCYFFPHPPPFGAWPGGDAVGGLYLQGTDAKEELGFFFGAFFSPKMHVATYIACFFREARAPPPPPTPPAAGARQQTHSALHDNALTGAVPPLPFKQYSGECLLDDPDYCTEPNCNHFTCPLPAGSEQCTYGGGTAGVHCK